MNRAGSLLPIEDVFAQHGLYPLLQHYRITLYNHIFLASSKSSLLIYWQMHNTDNQAKCHGPRQLLTSAADTMI